MKSLKAGISVNCIRTLTNLEKFCGKSDDYTDQNKLKYVHISLGSSCYDKSFDTLISSKLSIEVLSIDCHSFWFNTNLISEMINLNKLKITCENPCNSQVAKNIFNR